MGTTASRVLEHPDPRMAPMDWPQLLARSGQLARFPAPIRPRSAGCGSDAKPMNRLLSQPDRDGRFAFASAQPSSLRHSLRPVARNRSLWKLAACRGVEGTATNAGPSHSWAFAASGCRAGPLVQVSAGSADGLAECRQELTAGPSMGHARQIGRLATERSGNLAAMRM